MIRTQNCSNNKNRSVSPIKKPITSQHSTIINTATKDEFQKTKDFFSNLEEISRQNLTIVCQNRSHFKSQFSVYDQKKNDTDAYKNLSQREIKEEKVEEIEDNDPNNKLKSQYQITNNNNTISKKNNILFKLRSNMINV